ncbi:MAG: macro domain-containing protein [Clostridium sp.]
MTTFNILSGDITKLTFDAIVNAANTSLLGGGGVDGCIHRASGSRLLEECKQLGGCMTGNSKITQSYDLTNIGTYWIIHTVGPIFRNNGSEEKYLRHSYKSALEVAANYADIYLNQSINIFNNQLYRFNTSNFLGGNKKESLIEDIKNYINNHPIKTLAFPSISTGAYGYPLEDASKIALEEIFSFINEYPNAFDQISMICHDQKTLDVFNNQYEKYNTKITSNLN